VARRALAADRQPDPTGQLVRRRLSMGGWMALLAPSLARAREGPHSLIAGPDFTKS